MTLTPKSISVSVLFIFIFYYKKIHKCLLKDFLNTLFESEFHSLHKNHEKFKKLDILLSFDFRDFYFLKVLTFKMLIERSITFFT